MLNPYESGAETASIRPWGSQSLNIQSEGFERRMLTEFEKLGFACEMGVRVGSYSVALLCTKRGANMVPYTDRFCVYRLSRNVEPSVPLLMEMHAASRSHAERFHSFPRWLRLRIPNTVTVVLHEALIPAEVLKAICVNRLPSQTDGPHSISLVGVVDGEINYHQQTGFFASVHLRRANEVLISVIGC